MMVNVKLGKEIRKDVIIMWPSIWYQASMWSKGIWNLGGHSHIVETGRVPV